MNYRAIKKRQLVALDGEKQRLQFIDYVSVQGQRGHPCGQPIHFVTDAMKFLRHRLAKRGFSMKWEDLGNNQVKMYLRGRVSRFVYTGSWKWVNPQGLVLRELR